MANYLLSEGVFCAFIIYMFNRFLIAACMVVPRFLSMQ